MIPNFFFCCFFIFEKIDITFEMIDINQKNYFQNLALLSDKIYIVRPSKSTKIQTSYLNNSREF